MKFFKYNAVKVWMSDDEIFAELDNGQKASLPIRSFPLLAAASKTEREKFEIIDGYALYWPALGEDLGIAGFFEQTAEGKGIEMLSSGRVK